MRLYANVFLIAFAGICLWAFAPSEKTSVQLTSSKGVNIPFKVRSQKLEWINGQLNLALLSGDNRLIQLNNISELFLKDTTFRHKHVSLILIDSNRTYKHHKRLLPLVEISCSEPRKGRPVTIKAQGKVFWNKAWYTVAVHYSGVLPDKKFMSQYKKSSR